MTITATGALILLVAAGLLLWRPALLLPLVIFFIPFSCTSVIDVRAITYSIAPTVIVTLFYVVSVVFRGAWTRRVGVARDLLPCLGLLIAFALFVLLSLCIAVFRSGLNINEITQTTFLMFGIGMTLIFAIALGSEEQLDRAINAFTWSTIFICLWGMVQLVCFYAHIPYPAIVFNNSISDFSNMYDQRAGSAVRIASVAIEPSFLAFSLLSFFCFGATVAFVRNERVKGLPLAVGLAGLVLVIATSSTGYFGLALFLVLVLAQRPALLPVVGLPVVLAGTLALAVLPKLRAAIWQTTFGKTQTFSYKDRTGSMAEALDRFHHYPLAGQGWASDYSYSMVTQLLANTGAIGTLLFALAAGATLLAARLLRRALEARGERRTAALLLGAANGFTVLIGASVVSGFHYVTLDMWFIWGLLIALLTHARRRLGAAPAGRIERPAPRALLPAGVLR